MVNRVLNNYIKKYRFNRIRKCIENNITTFDINSLKTSNGKTQEKERISITLVSKCLDKLNYSYVEAGSQQSKDFRNICDCGLNINWKWKSDYEFQRLDELGDLNTYDQEGYQIFNFNLFKKFPLIQSSFKIGIKNLFDITDINYAMQEGVHNSAVNSISWGRTYFIQLNWQPF